MRANQNILRVLCFILICTILFTFAGSNIVLNVSGSSKTIEELDREIAERNKKIKQLEQDNKKQDELRQELQKQVAAIEKQINQCIKDIQELEAKIKQNEQALEQKNEELYKNKSMFKYRLRAMYMCGGNNGLEVLLGSDDFADFLAKTELTRSISELDNALIQEVVNSIKEIETIQTSIQTQKQQLENTKKTLSKKRSDINSQVTKLNSIITKNNQQKQKLVEDNKAAEQERERLKRQAKQKYNVNINFNGQFAWPVPGYYNITSGYGMRWGRLHKGIDIASSGIYGKPVVAVADGVVLVAQYNTGGYGNYVVISHGKQNGKSYDTLYGHLSSYCVRAGQSVKRGQVIGYVGSTGYSTGPHLHYEIHVNDVAVNPMNFYK